MSSKLNWLDVIIPNRVIPGRITRYLVLGELALLLIVWALSPFTFFPTPVETYNGFISLCQNYGLISELIVSFLLNTQAIVVSTIVSLLVAYSSTIPACRPIVSLISKLRFLSLAGLSFYFTLMTSTGHQLKLLTLSFLIIVFFVTSMADVVEQVPKEQYDLARVLKMGPWESLWEVVILGKSDAAMDVLRQSAAIGWMMLTMVEAMSRVEGGVGALLGTQNKYMKLEAIVAIQICIFGLGLLQDFGLRKLKDLIRPDAKLTLERR